MHRSDMRVETEAWQTEEVDQPEWERKRRQESGCECETHDMLCEYKIHISHVQECHKEAHYFIALVSYNKDIKKNKLPHPPSLPSWPTPHPGIIVEVVT